MGSFAKELVEALSNRNHNYTITVTFFDREQVLRKRS